MISSSSNPWSKWNRQLWDEHWHLVAHESELAAPDSFLRFDLAGEEVAIFNDGHDLVAFDNLCPHRGTRIYDGSEGKRRFVCPYHGWSYAKGRLFIPQKETFDSQNPSNARLTTYEIERLGGFVFISRRASSTLREQLGSFAEALTLIGESIASRPQFETYSYDCDWRIAVENALDQYHVALVHRDTLNKMRLGVGKNSYDGLNNALFTEVGDPRLDKQLSTFKKHFNLKYQHPGYMSIYLFPFTFISSTYGYSYSLQQFYPSDTIDKTHFTNRLFASKLTDAANRVAIDLLHETSIKVNHQVFQEDNEICKRIPTRAWSFDPPRYWCQGEEKILQFRSNLRGVLLDAATAAVN